MKKIITLCLSLCMTAALAAPAYALEYSIDAPDDYDFGRNTSIDVIHTADGGAMRNEDVSKNAALIPPVFGSESMNALHTGEYLTPNLAPRTLPTAGAVISGNGDVVSKCVQVESDKPYTGEAPVKSTTTKPVEQPAQTDVAAAKQDIIDRTNALRRENGAAALRVNDKLMQAAQVRADEMASSSVYSHTRPDGRRNTSVTDCPYVGENIHRIADWALQGKSVSEAAVWSWNLSGGHRDNLLEKNYAETGVGLSRGVNDSGEACWYCVQLFLWNGYSISWVDTPAAK